MPSPKMVFFTDLHINKNVHGPKEKNGYPTLVMDIYKNLEMVVDFCISESVEFLLFGGDAYETSRPLEEYRHMFRREIIRAANSNIKCILIPGNHDMTKRETAEHALSEFRDIPLENLHLIDKPGFLRFTDVDFFCLPWQYEDFIEENFNLNKFTVAVAHCTVLGSQFQTGQVALTLGKDFSVNQSFFEQFDVSFLGHIHKPQILSEEPFIAYPGSGEFLTWGEVGDPHGFFYHNGDYVQFIKYNHRPRHTIEWDGIEQLPEVNSRAMYRVYVDDLNAPLVRTHFKDAFDIKIIQNITRKIRPEVLNIKDNMTHLEILVEYMGEDWTPEMKELWEEVRHVAKN